jgi:hypothetical protein
MRRTIIGLILAGALALAGCSDSEGDVGGDAAGGSGSSDDFCSDFEELDQRFDEDPEAAADTVAVVDALDELDPPEEIADDYTAVIDAGRRLADLDPDDPAAVEEAQQLSEEAAAAQGRVSDFLSTECGIDLSSSGSADTSG